MPKLNLTPDELLTTTRAVRKRLDLKRPVDLSLIRECLEIAMQAPSGSNVHRSHFLVVTDPEKKQALGDLYRSAYEQYRTLPIAIGHAYPDDPVRDAEQKRAKVSAEFLVEHMHEVPVLVIPCVQQWPQMADAPFRDNVGTWACLLPMVWSFMLACRARGLGTSWTSIAQTFHEEEIAKVLGLPDDGSVRQGAMIPVAHTIGTVFKPKRTEPLDDFLHINGWKWSA